MYSTLQIRGRRARCQNRVALQSLTRFVNSACSALSRHHGGSYSDKYVYQKGHNLC